MTNTQYTMPIATDRLCTILGTICSNASTQSHAGEMKYITPHNKKLKWLSDAAQLLEACISKKIETHLHTADPEQDINDLNKFRNLNNYASSLVDYHHSQNKVRSVSFASSYVSSTLNWTQNYICPVWQIMCSRYINSSIIVMWYVRTPLFESLRGWHIHFWDLCRPTVHVLLFCLHHILW